jgi:phosphate transport system protein
MVRDALDSLVSRDADKARLVCLADDEVDREHRLMYSLIQDRMKSDARTIERSIQILSVSRQLERIADLATNIAQDVVFMVEGIMIRHRSPTAGAGPADGGGSR